MDGFSQRPLAALRRGQQPGQQTARLKLGQQYTWLSLVSFIEILWVIFLNETIDSLAQAIICCSSGDATIADRPQFLIIRQVVSNAIDRFLFDHVNSPGSPM